MTTENIAPGGDGEAVTVVPVSDESPISPRDAAAALTDWRRKNDEQPAEAPTEAAEPEPESPTTEDAAPAEEATSEQETETTEPAEELPPIEPPRSWTKEQKAQFSEL